MPDRNKSTGPLVQRARRRFSWTCAAAAAVPRRRCAALKNSAPTPQVPKPRAKNDPRHVAAARELRDRYLEHVNAEPSALVSEGKYDVSRRIEGREHAKPRLLAG